jgi:hypothetical protein
MNYEVVEYRDGKFYGVVSGLGRNAGKWDSAHSLRTAQKWAKEMNKTAAAGVTFVVERA